MQNSQNQSKTQSSTQKKTIHKQNLPAEIPTKNNAFSFSSSKFTRTFYFCCIEAQISTSSKLCRNSFKKSRSKSSKVHNFFRLFASLFIFVALLCNNSASPYMNSIYSCIAFALLNLRSIPAPNSQLLSSDCLEMSSSDSVSSGDTGLWRFSAPGKTILFGEHAVVYGKVSYFWI